MREELVIQPGARASGVLPRAIALGGDESPDLAREAPGVSAHFSWFSEELPDWYSPDGAWLGPEAEELRAVRAFADSVTGWLSPSQGTTLYELARKPLEGEILEIGSFLGKSTIFIALGCKHSRALFYTVDPHIPMSRGGKEQFGPDFRPYLGCSLEEFRLTLARSGLGAHVTPVVATSEEARRRLHDLRLKLLFIDGSHDYRDVVLDYYLWHEMIAPGGYLVFHDANFESVNRAIRAHVDRQRYVYDGTIGGGGWAMTLWRRER